MPAQKARFYESSPDGSVRCTLCPHRCLIKPGRRGFCNTRENRDGELYSLIYGELTAAAVDPVEKKPLFHFEPGSGTFSISSWGCNFHCPWCQNWHISQARPGDVATAQASPERIVEMAKRHNCPSISFTYNEPIIWMEFVVDVSEIAKKQGIKTVLVTNGYITPEALEQVYHLIDAANVDVKGFNEEFYRKYCGAELEAVLQAVEMMHEKGIHVETTNLIIPGLNDDMEEFRRMCRWHLDSLGPDVPLHVSRFFPQYKMTHLMPTPVETLAKAWKIAREEGLNYVYVGNLPGNEGEHTYCPNCGELVIKRYGFRIERWKLDDEMRCPKCGTKIPITGEYHPSGGGLPFSLL